MADSTERRTIYVGNLDLESNIYELDQQVYGLNSYIQLDPLYISQIFAVDRHNLLRSAYYSWIVLGNKFKAFHCQTLAVLKLLQPWSGKSADAMQERVKQYESWLLKNIEATHEMVLCLGRIARSYCQASKDVFPVSDIEENRVEINFFRRNNFLGSGFEQIALLDLEYEIMRSKNTKAMIKHCEEVTFAIKKLPVFPELSKIL